MAISSNRSPSPISSKTNSDSRTPESSNTFIRKSFNGNPLTRPSIVANSRSFNPVTPANSPAESLRRNLGSKEGFSTLRGLNEYKENEKDQKKVKEGFVSKGANKSFMAPTISAISKISPSPRKKVLTDRNETVRSSVADSEGKSLMDEDLSELTEEIGSQVLSESQNLSFKPKVDSIASLIPESLNVTATPLIPSSNSLEFKAIEETNLKSEIIHKPPASPSPVVDLVDSDPLFPHYEFKANNVSSNSKTKTPSSPIAPLDSDPHLPPYDPKTNYLSPRPRFLHYKPKPRIELCLNNENESDSSEGRKLEDSFTSESCSDTENTEESQSSGSLMESENVCSSELISKEETHVTETEPEYTQLKEVSIRSKSSSFVRSKIAPLLLVFVIACVFIPVIDTPVLSPSSYKGQSFKFDGSAKLAEFAKANVDELALNVKLWSAKTFSYVSTLISTPRGAVELHPLYFSNSTVSSEEPLSNRDYQFKEYVSIETEDKLDQIDLDFEMWGGSEEMQNEEELEVEEADIEFEEQPPLMHAATEVESENVEGFEFHEQDNIDFHTNPEPIINQVTLQGAELDASTPTQSPELDVLPPKSDLDSYAPVEGSELDVIAQSAEIDTPIQSSELDVIAQSAEIDTPIQSLELDVPSQSIEIAAYITENLSSVQYVVGIVSAVLIMVATTAYVYLKQKKATTLVVDDQVQQLLPKKMASSSISGSGDSEHQDRISYRPTQVEMVGESGPSEMSSSFKRSLSYGLRESERVSEVQSQEKRQRYSKKESLAASDYSAGSPSYGSFTTYEKIHSKHGCGEEEVVTPVRRSSRIRKITSP
ncbi:hypothetical protein AQUCO_01500240v1 [Aquilegia coerulea]|uniref:Uncharacterized protein n=1 Tax=Aquilegia coerulea TaxID=218851 RepID=A0A2G5DSQ5_AQUCA|nr:hypothetical protein AQUCO_01500240v1 [Aquilegia coerulea]